MSRMDYSGIEVDIRYLKRRLGDYFEIHREGGPTPRMTLDYASFEDLIEKLNKFSRPYLVAELKKTNLEALEPLKEFIKENKPHLDSLDISKFEGVIDTDAHRKLVKEHDLLGFKSAWDLKWKFLKDLGGSAFTSDSPVTKRTLRGETVGEELAYDADELTDIAMEWLESTVFMGSKRIYCDP